MSESPRQGIHISSQNLYRTVVFSYVLALVAFLGGCIITGKWIFPLFLCLPLILMLPLVIGKRRRYYQLIPNILVLYIGGALAELFINPAMHLYAAIALIAWVLALITMLLLVRTNYLIDGGHYISTRKKKKKPK